MTSPMDIGLPLSFESAHLSFSELWLVLTHSSLGGAGGKGRADNLADGPNGPMPRALTACKLKLKLTLSQIATVDRCNLSKGIHVHTLFIKSDKLSLIKKCSFMFCFWTKKYYTAICTYWLSLIKHNV